MSEKQEENTIQLKVEEEEVKNEEEEEVEQEEEGNEEEEQKEENQEQKDRNEDQNKIELKKEDDEEEDAEVQENIDNRIVLQEEGNQQEVKKTKDEYFLSPELKVNVEWFIDDNENVDILFSTDSKQKLVLHWGVSNANSQGKWSHIDSLCYPPLSKDFDDYALETDFSYLDNDNIKQQIHIKSPKEDFNSLNFVFLEKDSNRWYNNGEKDYHIYLN